MSKKVGLDYLSSDKEELLKACSCKFVEGYSISCMDHTKCDNCGFNPEVAAARLESFKSRIFQKNLKQSQCLTAIVATSSSMNMRKLEAGLVLNDEKRYLFLKDPKSNLTISIPQAQFAIIEDLINQARRMKGESA